MAPYLAKPWRDVDFAFRGVVLRGQTAPLPRQQQVLDAINLAAGPMLGREYVGRYLPDATVRVRPRSPPRSATRSVAASIATPG